MRVIDAFESRLVVSLLPMIVLQCQSYDDLLFKDRTTVNGIYRRMTQSASALRTRRRTLANLPGMRCPEFLDTQDRWLGFTKSQYRASKKVANSRAKKNRTTTRIAHTRTTAQRQAEPSILAPSRDCCASTSTGTDKQNALKIPKESARSMDSAKVKELLQSTDISLLKDTLRVYQDVNPEEDARQQEQLLKLQILLWSRILHLQQNDPNCNPLDIVESYHHLSRCWMSMGDTTKAIGQLRHALAVQADNCQTLQLLSDAHLSSADYESAIDWQEKAINGMQERRKDGASVCFAYGNLGAIFEAKGDFEQAIAVLQKGQSFLPSDNNVALPTGEAADLAVRLGMLLEKMGQYTKAVQELTVAHKMLVHLKGEGDAQAEEVAYLLDMASNMVE